MNIRIRSTIKTGAFADEYEIELVVDDTIVEDITLVD